VVGGVVAVVGATVVGAVGEFGARLGTGGWRHPVTTTLAATRSGTRATPRIVDLSPFTRSSTFGGDHVVSARS